MTWLRVWRCAALALPPHLPRLFNIGRLDTQTEGLLVLTNGGELAQHGGGAPQHAVAWRVGEGAAEVPLDLGEQAAAGDEAVGAQLGVVGQVQVDVHDASSTRAAWPPSAGWPPPRSSRRP